MNAPLMTPRTIRTGVNRSGRVVYQEIRHTEIRQGNCSACGKPTNRQRTFNLTVNPTNRRADGTIKTADEVRADILTMARAWSPNHDHQNCPQIRAERVLRKRGGRL